MITKRRVRLGSAQLDEIDERIIIQGVEPQAGKDSITAVSLWGADGSRVTGRHRDYLDIQIKFSLDIKRARFSERSEVFDKIAGWAMGGGWLRTSTKPERKIRVICAQLPAEGDPMAWTNQYSITMRAYGVPYWQTDSKTSAKKTSAVNGSVNLEVPGNTETVIDAEFENTSTGTINTLKISAGDSKIELADLGLAIGETLVIDHSDNGQRNVIRIRIRNVGGSYRSVLDKRTEKSSNDLTAESGTVSVSYEAQRKGTLTVSCNGRFA